MKFQKDSVVYVKLSGEPVYLLGTRGEEYKAKRFVPSHTGSFYSVEYFTEGELESEDERTAREKADMEQVLGLVAPAAAQPTPTPSTAN